MKHRNTQQAHNSRASSRQYSDAFGAGRQGHDRDDGNVGGYRYEDRADSRFDPSRDRPSARGTDIGPYPGGDVQPSGNTDKSCSAMTAGNSA